MWGILIIALPHCKMSNIVQFVSRRPDLLQDRTYRVHGAKSVWTLFD